MTGRHEVESDELLRRAGGGDRDAFGRVLEKYSERLLTRIRILLGPEVREQADSDDFLQGTFFEALRYYDERGLATERDFLRWLTAVARNNVRDAARRPRQLAFESLSDELLGGGSDGAPDPAQEAARAEAHYRLLDALEELSADRRQVVELRSLEGLTFPEVAERTGRNVDAARMLHTRAILELVRKLRTGE